MTYHYRSFSEFRSDLKQSAFGVANILAAAATILYLFFSPLYFLSSILTVDSFQELKEKISTFRGKLYYTGLDMIYRLITGIKNVGTLFQIPVRLLATGFEGIVNLWRFIRHWREKVKPEDTNGREASAILSQASYPGFQALLKKIGASFKERYSFASVKQLASPYSSKEEILEDTRHVGRGLKSIIVGILGFAWQVLVLPAQIVVNVAYGLSLSQPPSQFKERATYDDSLYTLVGTAYLVFCGLTDLGKILSIPFKLALTVGHHLYRSVVKEKTDSQHELPSKTEAPNYSFLSDVDSSADDSVGYDSQDASLDASLEDMHKTEELSVTPDDSLISTPISDSDIDYDYDTAREAAFGFFEKKNREKYSKSQQDIKKDIQRVKQDIKKDDANDDFIKSILG